MHHLFLYVLALAFALLASPTAIAQKAAGDIDLVIVLDSSVTTRLENVKLWVYAPDGSLVNTLPLLYHPGRLSMDKPTRDSLLRSEYTLELTFSYTDQYPSGPTTFECKVPVRGIWFLHKFVVLEINNVFKRQNSRNAHPQQAYQMLLKTDIVLLNNYQ